MSWIELIRVRSSPTMLERAMPRILHHIEQLTDTRDDMETFFVQHGRYDGDIALVVVWRDDGTRGKTHEGVVIAEHLGTLGSVDHAVWLPITP